METKESSPKKRLLSGMPHLTLAMMIAGVSKNVMVTITQSHANYQLYKQYLYNVMFKALG